MHVVITYPDEATEGEIIKLNRAETAQNRRTMPRSSAGTATGHPRRARRDRRYLRLRPRAEIYRRYRLCDPVSCPIRRSLGKWIQVGASPRGSLALDRCARVRAWLDGHEFVTPDHVRAVVHDCLRHRLILSYEALSQGVNADQVIDKITELVAAA